MIPTFSIIIPTLNEERYLPHLLGDLSQQTFQDFEVIIVDGNSTDKTISKAKEYTKILPSLQIISSEKKHVCIQRNLGAEKAKSDWLIFMDADNRLPTYFLQGVKYRLESEPCDLAYTWISPEKDTPQNKIIVTAINLFYDAQVTFSKVPSGLESMIIVKKNNFLHVGGFDPSIDFAEGRFLVNEVAKAGGKCTIFRDPQYTYSLRRLKKFGTIRTISIVAQSEIFNLFGINPPSNSYARKYYPMLGGGVYNSRYQLNKRKIPRFIKNIQKLLKDL